MGVNSYLRFSYLVLGILEFNSVWSADRRLQVKQLYSWRKYFVWQLSYLRFSYLVLGILEFNSVWSAGDNLQVKQLYFWRKYSVW